MGESLRGPALYSLVAALCAVRGARNVVWDMGSTQLDTDSSRSDIAGP